MENKKNVVDAAGTNQEEAVEMLENLLENGFSSDVEKLALALGRDSDQIEDILDGEEIVDDDLAMKIRGIAQQKDIEIE